MKNVSYQISFQIYQNQEIAFRFEEEIVVFFGLNGSSQIFCGNRVCELLPAGLLVINPFEVYRLTCLRGASVICLRIPRSILNLYGWQSTIQYSCYARSNQEEQPEYRKLRELIAVIFQEYFEYSDVSSVSSGNVRQLLRLLQTDFAVNQPVQMQRESTMRRLKRILDIIHEHWNEEISLSEIAKQEYLSISYLSRFFQKNLHMSFSQYLKELRLSHSRQLLMRSAMSITRISYDCGFRTPSAFIEAFKQQYHQTPGQFRQAQQASHSQQAVALPQNGSHRDVSVLLAYVPEERVVEIPERTQQIQVDCSEQLPVKTIPWRQILNIGYARDGLMAPIQEQIRRAQREIGFEFIRFHGILDEDMHIYREDAQGRPEFYFSYVDLLFDFIIQLGLKPFVELSFMPSPLAREQTKIFDRPSVISGCIALDKWSELVYAALQHFIERYGREEVRKWRFTTISLSYVHLKCVDWEDYQELFENTWKTVKRVDSELQFGGPGCFAELIGRKEGIPAFFDFAQKHNCLPDFVSFQFNPNIQTDDSLFMDFTLSQQSTPAILSEDSDYLVHSLDQLEQLMAQYSLSDREIYLEESTSTLWQRDLSSETCYKSAWLAKNVCESCDRAIFGYWLLTDLMEERATLETVFHGGYGLLTYNGIPKAGYQAMRLIRRMGDTFIASGKGWLLTKSGEDYQLMIYNYCNYSRMYRYRYARLDQPQDAYSVFETGEILHMLFQLDGWKSGTYRVERRTITREHGSSFDQWMKIGTPRYPSQDELNYLIDMSQPAYRVETIEVCDKLQCEVVLQPLEVEHLYFHRINT